MDARIVAAERGPLGGRLVFVGLDGRRLIPLTEAVDVPIIDQSPRFSPDGSVLVFASTRGRSTLDQSSLWLVAPKPRAQPRRLTTHDSVDRDPTWTPDGRAVVFSSDRAGTFDLWMQRIAPDRWGRLSADGPPVALTSGAGHERSPSVSPDGTKVVYMAMSLDPPTSALEVIEIGEIGSAEDGGIDVPAPRRITEGPADYTPAWSPDGSHIALAAPADPDDETRTDADLFLIRPDGSERRRIVDEPLADQSGPIWSSDGRFVFAISVFRSAESHEAVLASVTFVDMEDTPRVLRALHDPVAVESRTGATLDGKPLDPDALREHEPYAPALRRVVQEEVLRAIEQAREREQRERKQRERKDHDGRPDRE